MTKNLPYAARAALTGLGAFALAPLASAAIVTGNWDPPMVSPPFDNLGWTATINFFVPDECLGSSGIVNVRLFNRSYGCSVPTPAITVLRAQIGIYDLNTEVLKYVITLNASSLRPNLLDISSNGQVTYLYSLLPSAGERLTIAGDDLTDNGNNPKDYWFRLALPGSAPELQYSDTGRFSDFDPASGTPPTLVSFRTDPNTAQSTVLSETELVVGSSINPVPEPQSLALTLLALGVAGMAARRRLGQVPPQRAA